MSLIGKMLGSFRIISLLGEGGMGAVYLARDLSLERDVAIKLIHPHLARQPTFLERFIQEARLMARLDHPGFVRVYTLGKEGDLLYLPMEFIKGGNLRELLDRLSTEGKWLPLNEAVLLVQQLCQTVEYAHQQGVLHRDIKPANLMLKPELTDGLPFRVILTDLGLARLAEGLGFTQEGTSMGTPAYMSPEQALGKATDPRSDVYSLGILLYELAAKQRPFAIRTLTEATRYHTQVQPPAPRSINPDVPEALERVILKALEKDPAKRYTSAQQLASALTGTLTTATEIVEPGDRVSLITEYQQSVIAPPRPGAGGSKTMFENEPAPPRGDSVFGDGSIAPSAEARIQIIPKDQTAKVMTMQSATVTIGRDESNHIVLDDAKASRRHAQITWDGMEYHVMDLNSRNGTFLENAPLLPGVAEVLKPNQKVRIGDTWLRLLESTSQPRSVSATRSIPAGSSVYKSSGTGIMAVNVTPEQLTVEPGSSVTAKISILNQSNKVDHYSFLVSGVPDPWVSLPEEVQLMPTERREVECTLSVPRVYQSQAGPSSMLLRVTSLNDPSQFVEIKRMLTVAAFSQFKAELPPRIRVGQSSQLTVTNLGNIPESFSVLFSDPAEELSFEPANTMLSARPGEQVSLPFRALTKQPRIVGGQSMHPVTAQVGLPKGEHQTLQAQVISRGLIPIWVPPILLLLCCSFIVLAGRFVPPLLFPTPTSTLTPTSTGTLLPTFTATATPEPGAPVIDRWCVYPSNQPPPEPCPIQVNIPAGQTVTIEWRVSNAEQVVITPLGNQAPADTISSYTVAQNTTFTIEATNAAQKKIQKTIQVNVDPPTPTPITPTLVTPDTPVPPPTTPVPPPTTPAPPPTTPVPPPTTVVPTPKTYRDDHVGWAGESRYAYTYGFTVDDFLPGRRYVLSAKGMIPVISVSCGGTRGSIIVTDPFGRTAQVGWDNNDFLCMGGFRGWPNHPNDGLPQSQIDFVNRELKPYGRELVRSLGDFVTGNGYYRVEWGWRAGCCGVYIWDVQLRPVP